MSNLADSKTADEHCWIRGYKEMSRLGHCGYHRYLYHQGNEQTTDGTVEAAAKPWLIKSAPSAIPFDTPVLGMERGEVTEGADGSAKLSYG